MSDLRLVPLSYADQMSLAELMDEEEQAWLCELDWDYAPVRAILDSFITQNLLPGYVVVQVCRPLGYGYFLMHQNKGIIGTVYASKSDLQQEVADTILIHAIQSLKDKERISRIEAQIMPFNNLSLTTIFKRHGFQYYPRYFLELDLVSYCGHQELAPPATIIPWDSASLAGAADVAYKGYKDETDALLCEDYRSPTGCEGYLRSLMDNPGCGIFLPEASFMGLDSHGLLCGFVVSSRLSAFAGMIPQIAILPSYQGRGLGNALMDHALSQFNALEMRTVSLTVTEKNRRAFEWYQRLGFKIRKEFGAYVWDRF